MPEDEAKERLERIVNAFNQAMIASLRTLSAIDPVKLGDLTPNDFAQKFCSSPLGVFSISIEELEISKEQKLKFYSLPERQVEFVPVSRAR